MPPERPGQPRPVLRRGAGETEALLGVVAEGGEAQPGPGAAVGHLGQQLTEPPLEGVLEEEQLADLGVERAAAPPVPAIASSSARRSSSTPASASAQDGSPSSGRWLQRPVNRVSAPSTTARCSPCRNGRRSMSGGSPAVRASPTSDETKAVTVPRPPSTDRKSSRASSKVVRTGAGARKLIRTRGPSEGEETVDPVASSPAPDGEP
ncbi:MAG: hypothetical protein PVF68_09875, partial [Acidobacteriota bacterium]